MKRYLGPCFLISWLVWLCIRLLVLDPADRYDGNLLVNLTVSLLLTALLMLIIYAVRRFRGITGDGDN